ncbi:MAG TPA: hypothetical protein VGL45_12570, partial [Bradyrhizobium sp.]
PPWCGKAKLAEGIASGKASANAAAVVNSLKLIIVGSFNGISANRFGGRTFPSLAPIVRERQIVRAQLYAE